MVSSTDERGGNYSNEETQKLKIACVHCERKRRVVIVSEKGVETIDYVSNTSQPKCINHLRSAISDKQYVQFTKLGEQNLVTKPGEQDSSFIGSIFKVMNKYLESNDRLKDCIDCEKKFVKYRRNLVRTDSLHLEYVREHIFFSHSINKQCRNPYIHKKRLKIVPYPENNEQPIQFIKSGEESSGLTGWIFMIIRKYVKSNNDTVKDCIDCQKKLVRYGEVFFPTDSSHLEYVHQHIFYSHSNKRQCKNPYFHMRRVKVVPYPDNKREDVTIIQRTLKPKSVIMKVGMYLREKENKKLQALGGNETNARDKLLGKIPAKRFFGYFNNERQSVLYFPSKHLMCYIGIKQKDYGYYGGVVRSLSNLPQIDELVKSTTHSVLPTSTVTSTQGFSNLEMTSFYENAFKESIVEESTSSSDTEILSSFAKVLEMSTEKVREDELSKSPTLHKASTVTSDQGKSGLGVASFYESTSSASMVEKVIKSSRAEILCGYRRSSEWPAKEADRTFASKEIEATKSFIPLHESPKTVSLNERDSTDFPQEIRDSYTQMEFKQVKASSGIKEADKNLLKTLYPNQIEANIDGVTENLENESWQVATPVLKEIEVMPLESNFQSELSYASAASIEMTFSDTKTAVRINEQGDNVMTMKSDIDVTASFKYGTESIKTSIIQRSFLSLETSEVTLPKSTISPPVLKSNSILDEAFRISSRYKRTSFALTGTENDYVVGTSSKKVISQQSAETLVGKSVAKSVMTESIRDLTEYHNVQDLPGHESSTMSERSSTTSDVPESKRYFEMKMGAFGPSSVVTKSSSSPISKNTIKEEAGRDVPLVFSQLPVLTENIESPADNGMRESRKVHEKSYLQGVGGGVSSLANEQMGVHLMSKKTSRYQEEVTALRRDSSNLDNEVKAIHRTISEINADMITRSMEYSLSETTRKSMKEVENVVRNTKDREDYSQGSKLTYESTSLQRSVSANLVGRKNKTSDEKMSLKEIVKATVKSSKTNEYHTIDERKLDSSRQEAKTTIHRILSTSAIAPKNEVNSLRKSNMATGKFTPQLETATIGMSVDPIVGKETEKPPYDIRKDARISSDSDEIHGTVTREHKIEVIDQVHGFEPGEVEKSPILVLPEEMEEGKFIIVLVH